MKRMEIFCASQASTAICSSMDPASSSSYTSTIRLGGRAIDRHNPIIRDSRRFTRTGLPVNPCVSQPQHIDPKRYQYHQLQKTKKNSSGKQNDKKAKKSSSSSAISGDEKKKKKCSLKKTDAITRKSFLDAGKRNEAIYRKSTFEARDKVVSARKNWAPPEDLVTPPDSSRYLLSNTAFLDGITDNDSVKTLAPFEPKKNQSLNQDESIAPKHSSSSQLEKPSQDQVVILRVSLHCKGCEGKVRKHLSRMEGVRSFNIDFAAKKVTIVGNVTPLSVLASVSKVKNAQFWSSAMASSAAATPAPASSNLAAAAIK
ncbi:hypothetical protein SLA2020_459370 [Shorea laevis]